MLSYVTARRITHIAYAILITVMLVGVGAVYFMLRGDELSGKDSLYLRDWRDEMGAKVVLSGRVRVPEGAENAVLERELPKGLGSEVTLAFFSDAPSLKVFLEENCLYNFSKLDGEVDEWHFIALPTAGEGQTLRIVFSGAESLMVDAVCLGSPNGVINAIWKEYLLSLMLEAGILTCGIVMIIVALNARKQWNQTVQTYWVEYAYLWHLGFFLIVLAAWLFLRSGLAYLLIENKSAIVFLKYTAASALLPLFFPHYRQIFVRDRRWILDILFLVLSTYFFSSFVMVLLGIIDYSETRIILRILLWASVMWVVIFLFFLRGKGEQEDWNQRCAASATIVVSLLVERACDIWGHAVIWEQQSFFFGVGILIYCCFICSFTTGRAVGRIAEIAETKEQLLQSKISLLLSQIRPHFIFNVLNSISTLCTTDPNEAQVTVKRFSDYLRFNIDALSQKGCLPFERELAFVESYVNLEKLRFGERLAVEYDIQTTSFSVPLLTIQPLVENAIRHGICNKRDGGTVWIRTYQTNDDFCVEVEDNGVGFAYTSKQPKTHKAVALDNIVLRLQGLAHGVVEISDREGGGTRVLVRLPAGYHGEQNDGEPLE